jgi:lactate permease
VPLFRIAGLTPDGIGRIRVRGGLIYEQVYEPIGGNLALSTLVAVIPILVLFVLLAGLRLVAQWASLITLAVALVIAVLVYGMPIDLALNSTLLGI